MLLDLTQIRQPDVDVSRRYDPSQFEGRGNQFRVVAPVDLRFKVHKDKQRFRLVGTVSSAVELTCSRCLEPFQQPIDAIFDLRYLPQSENAGEERQVEEDDLSEAFYRDDVIDLGQLIDEQFYLAFKTSSFENTRKKASHTRRPARDDRRHLPAVWRTESRASRVPLLRLLSTASGPSR